MCRSYSLTAKLISLFASVFILLYSCNTSVEKGDKYLYQINDEVSAVKYQPEKIKLLEKRELEKYKKSGDRLYLLSSKYCELFNYQGDLLEPKQVPLVYELLSLNNNKYNFITIAGNFNLAYKFVKVSPDQTMQFLDKAINIDENTGKMYLLPHMYHLKGKLYYDKKEYKKALLYFNKALEGYIKNGRQIDILYVASMYSNLSMVYKEINNLDLAIEKLQKGIDVLKRKKNLNLEEEYSIQFFSGTLATYFMEKKDYPAAEKLLVTELEFCKKVKFQDDAVVSSQRLVDIYTITGEKEKYHAVINFLIDLEPRIKIQSLRFRIVTNELLRDYYAEMNDIQNLKSTATRLESLQQKQNTISEEALQNASFTLYKNVLQKTGEEYDRKMADNKKKTWALVILISFVVLFLIWLITYIRKKNKKEKELLEQQKLLLEDHEKLLEKDVQLHKEKNKNLHLNLNLKTETEKALLENLKKIRRTKKTDIEENLKELQFKVNNLIQIDKKNYDFMNESSLENKLFMEKLSLQFPGLTEQELNLCVYFKLNLSSKEISLLEGITSGSVRVYKTKIKSKIGLGKEEKLDDFLNTI